MGCGLALEGGRVDGVRTVVAGVVSEAGPALVDLERRRSGCLGHFLDQALQPIVPQRRQGLELCLPLYSPGTCAPPFGMRQSRFL